MFTIVDGQVVVTDGDGNPITSTTNDTKQLLDTIGVLRDAITPENTAKVDNLGNQYFLTPQPQTPAGKNAIGYTFYADNSGTEDIYTTIPNGETITIQRFKGGAEYDSNGGTVITLWYAPNGDNTNLEIIEAIFTNGNSDYSDLNYNSSVGDGTRSILMRLEHLSGGSVKTFGKWEGYY